MIVVDSNVLAYLLIEGEKTPVARTLFERDPDWHSASFAPLELTNILATSVRVGRLDGASANQALAKALALMENSLHELPHAQVLALANRLRISAYDAVYLGVSIELGVPLVTEDRRLREAAPDRCLSLAPAAAGE
jgi:predicted nucleic acid-binding protein